MKLNTLVILSDVLYLGTVHKGRPHSGGRWFVQCGDFSDKGRGGIFQMRKSALFDAKLRIFRNLWCVRTDKGV